MPNRASVTPSSSIAAAIKTALVVACLLLVPAAAGQPSKPRSIWAGTWRTEWGTIKLVQDDHVVEGTYTPGNGKIEAFDIGLTLKGRWSDVPTYKPPNDSGEFEVLLDDGLRSFSGRWRYGSSGEWNEGWNGKRMSAPPAPLRALDVILYKKTYVPSTSYVAHGARVRICNRDPFRHHPFTWDKLTRPKAAVLAEEECMSLVALNPTKRVREIRFYDSLHSNERMVIVVQPRKPGRPATPEPASLAWALKTTSVNPLGAPALSGSAVVARGGQLRWQIQEPPQVDFVVDYPKPPAALTPGARHGFPVTVQGWITGGRDTHGYRRIDAILYVNDRWDGSAVYIWQNCVDPIGSEPISCQPPASANGTFAVPVPRPSKRGEKFSYGVGALNCSPCYVRFEYVAQ